MLKQDSQTELYELIDKLASQHSLEIDEYAHLVADFDDDLAAYAAKLAVEVTRNVYGNQIFTRGLIEISSYCKNDCLYCGIRRSNKRSDRYRLSEEQILECCRNGFELGYRTFVLQGGEDPYLTDQRLCDIIHAIKAEFPDCAITLSLGERTRESYEALHDAGADRYLLRHESANPEHYAALHPEGMTLENRLACIRALRDAGFSVGIGYMVGSPFQTAHDLACDLKLVEEFQPEMCGIGPFVPHHATPFAHYPNGSVKLTCFLLSLMRLIKPNLLIPATTSLATLDPKGREQGVLSGANVVMPNLSPMEVRAHYDLYDNKICTGEAAERCRYRIQAHMRSIGYDTVVDRGDPA